MSAEAQQLPAVGEFVGDGRFELVSQLGEGGMSTVFLARDGLYAREVALKLLIPRYVGRPEREQRLINEADYLRRVQGHPNIIQFVDAGRLRDRNGWPWLTTEILEGQVLDWLFIRGKLELAKVVDIARQLAAALHACHQAGVVHRDITPSNVFLLEDQRTIKLFDFSHAGDLSTPKRPVGAPERLTGIFETPGTVGYIGPEQAVNAPADASMDVFGFGVLLFKLVTGRNPYRNISNRDAFIRAQREGTLDPPRLHAWAYDAPVELAELVHACTQRDGSQRPSVAEVIAQLDALDLHAPSIAPPDAQRQAAVQLGVEQIAEHDPEPEPEHDDQTAVQLPFARPPNLRGPAVVPELDWSTPAPTPEPESTSAHEPELEDASPTITHRRWQPLGWALLLALGLGAGLWFAQNRPPDAPHQNEPSHINPMPTPTDVDSGAVDPSDSAAHYEVVAEIEPEPVPEPKPRPKPKPKPEPSLPQAPSKPAPSCDGVERQGQLAADALDWPQVVKLTADKRCWSSATDRTWLRTLAMFELSRWAKCVDVGGTSTDPRVQKYVELCRSLLK